MSILTVQNDFTHGEFSPKLIARFDISLYNKGAAKLRNVMIINQGGARRRAGTLFLHDFLGTLTTNDFKMVEFQLSEDISYLFVFIVNEVLVFRDSILVDTIFGAPFDQSQIRDLKTAQTDNLMIVTHPDLKPRQIVNTDPTGASGGPFPGRRRAARGFRGRGPSVGWSDPRRPRRGCGRPERGRGRERIRRAHRGDGHPLAGRGR